MYKTIIVDDDFLVRSYLKQLKSWEKAGYAIAGDLRDGEEAMKAVEELQPDVVVTDISMPLMNGIELIRRIRRKYKWIYIMVLSCHDDFEYVREAMKLGADEYVLKNSLDEETLYDILDNAKLHIKARLEKTIKSYQTKKLIEMGRHSLKYHFFNGLLSGGLSAEEREKKRAEAGIKGKFMNSAVINMFIPDWNRIKNSATTLELEQYSQHFLQKLAQRLEENGEEEYVEAVYLGEGVFCCFLDLSEMRRSSLMRQRLTSTATLCFRCCSKEEYRFEVGVSNICFGEEGIRQAYQQAREMVKLSFYEASEILYYEGRPEIAKQLPKEAEQFLEEAPGYVKSGQYEQMKDGFLAVVELFKKNYVEPRLVLHWLKELDRSVKVERTPEEYGAIIRIEQVAELWGDYHEKLFLQKKREIPAGTSNAVRLVVDYLHIHFKEQIGLTEAAETAGLNPAYLSYLFKQEMGTGFSSYLLELRMKCAEGLLRGTNEKVKDVAQHSGFNDYHYFSKAFKKMHGVSPADYRKRESGI